KSHVSLIETRPARQTLAALFGAETLFSAEDLATKITLAVRNTAVRVDDDVHVLIEFTPEIDRFDGELRFQRAIVPEDAATPPTEWRDLSRPALPIGLVGAGFTYINVKAEPLEIKGVYRPVLTNHANDQRIVGPAFAAQPA